MDYEDIIEQIGGFGRWQIFIFIVLIIPEVCFCLSIMLPVFIGPAPNWMCEDYMSPASNYTVNSSAGHFYKNSTMTDLSIEGVKNCNSCDVRKYIDDFTSIVSEWDLVCDSDYVSDLISTIQMSGLLVGAALFAQTSDMYGRKLAHYTTVLVSTFSGVISAFSVNWQMFAAFRFIFGMSAGGYFCLNCVYPIEFVSRKWRAVTGALTIWSVGQGVLAFMAYFIRDWRHLTFWTAAIGVLYIITWKWIPESPRWLAQKGRIKEAKVVFSEIARRNGRKVPDLSCLDVLELKMTEKKEESKAHMYTYLDLFKSWRFLKPTLCTMFIWFVIFLVYYTNMMNIKHLSGNRYLNQVYGGLMDSVGMLLVVTFINILGRRLCLIIATFGGLIPNIILFTMYYLNKEDEHSSIVNGISLVQRSFMVGGTIIIGVYSAEVFPTDVRNIGVGAGSISARIGMLLGPQFVYLGTYYKTIPYLIMTIFCFALLPIYLLLPETTGKPLIDDYNLIGNSTAKDITELLVKEADDTTNSASLVDDCLCKNKYETEKCS